MVLSVVISKVTDDAIADEISAIIIVTDITQEKLIQKQKSDFFANASHELKTPITVMQGFAEVLMNKESMDENSKKHLPRLCERFYRVDKSHSKRIGGTGLGLAIVKHICAICDAELSIESEFGISTTVTVV